MTFNKKDTLMMKGVAICLLVAHHLFYDSAVQQSYGVFFPLMGSKLGYSFGQLAKICVFIFIFLTAFGIARATKTLRSVTLSAQQIDRSMTAYSITRYIQIMAGYLWVFVPVYVFAWVARGVGLPSPPDPVTLYSTGVAGFCYTVFDLTGIAFLMRSPTLCNEWWFWSIAILIVFAMPAFLRWYKRSGIATYAIALLLANWLFMIDREGMGHLTMLPLGIAFAERGWFEKFLGWRALKTQSTAANLLNALVRLLLCGAVFLFGMAFAATSISFYIGYQLATPALIFACWQLLRAVPFVTPALAFLGRHSMNIFLTHTVLLRAWPAFFYAPKAAPAVFLLLLGVALALSVVIEFIKKLSKYNHLSLFLQNKVHKWGEAKPAATASA